MSKGAILYDLGPLLDDALCSRSSSDSPTQQPDVRSGIGSRGGEVRPRASPLNLEPEQLMTPSDLAKRPLSSRLLQQLAVWLGYSAQCPS